MTRLYVACGVGGLLKAGMTTDIENRLICLKQNFKRFGDRFDRVVLCEDLPSIGSAERDAHFEIGQLATERIGREWYRGVDFDEAVSIAKAHTERAKRRTRTEVKEGV